MWHSVDLFWHKGLMSGHGSFITLDRDEDFEGGQVKSFFQGNTIASLMHLEKYRGAKCCPNFSTKENRAKISTSILESFKL